MRNHPIFLSILCLSTLHEVASAAVITIDNNTAGYGTSGSFSYQNGLPDRVNADWQYQNAANGNDTATYSFTGLASGNYVVATSTFNQANLSNSVTWTVSSGGGSYTLNQQLKTNHFDLDDGSDNTFARFSAGNVYTPVLVTGGNLTVSVSDNDTAGFLVTDAVRIESIRSDVQKMYIIGNNEPGYSESGTWATWSGDPDDHGADIRFSTGAGSITVAFTDIDPGIYRISSAWTSGGNRPSSVTMGYTTAGGSGSVSYNQQPGAAADDVFENVNWQDHFSNVIVTGTSLTLTLSNTDGALIGDGFRLELIPEPASGILCGLAGLLILRRRRP